MAKDTLDTKPKQDVKTDAPKGARNDLAHAENEIYGADAPRAADGSILEKGSGSVHQTLEVRDRIRLAALGTRSAAEEVISLAAALTAAAEKFAAAQKEVVEAASKH